LECIDALAARFVGKAARLDTRFGYKLGPRDGCFR
jgi:hypothetical protein